MSNKFSERDKASVLALKTQPFDQPYGGEDWPQYEGYSIYEWIEDNLEEVIYKELKNGN